MSKLFRDPTEVFTRAVQPVLWLVVFGQVFSRVRGIPTGNVCYLAFMTPGILAQSVLFAAIFYGIAVIWERDLGIVHKLLVSPAQRISLVLGKAVSAGFRGVVQAVIIYLIAIALRIAIRWQPSRHFRACLRASLLGSAIFATFSLIIACLVKSRERFMGIGQVHDHAALLRQQRDLSDRDHARVAESGGAGESADLSGGCAARPDDRRRRERARISPAISES